MIGDILNGERTGVDLVSLFVWDLKLELLLKRHHDLHYIKAVQPQILLEMHLRCHLKKKYYQIMKIITRIQSLKQGLGLGFNCKPWKG